MTTQETNLTPFETAQIRAAEFGENVCQASVWGLALEKLKNIKDPESPEGIATSVAIETLFAAIVNVPGTVTAEA